MKKQLPIGLIIKEAETLIGAEQVLNTLIYFDNDKGYMCGGSVYLASEENATMYTNGKSIVLKIKTTTGVVEFFFNGNKLPYSKTYNVEGKIIAQRIYNTIFEKDPSITRKIKCVKYIMNNFKDVYTFKANGRKISINSLRHNSTKLLISNRAVEEEIPPVTVNENVLPKEEIAISERKDDTNMDNKTLAKQKIKSAMSLAHKLRREYEREDPIFKASSYYERLRYTLQEAWDIINKIDTKEVEKEAAIGIVEPIDKYRKDPIKEEEKESKKDECTISTTDHEDKEYYNRNPNCVYVTFEVCKIHVEDHKGKKLNTVDISEEPHPLGNKYKDHGLNSTKRYFRNNALSGLTPAQVVVVSKDDTIFDRKDGHSYIIE